MLIIAHYLGGSSIRASCNTIWGIIPENAFLSPFHFYPGFNLSIIRCVIYGSVPWMGGGACIAQFFYQRHFVFIGYIGFRHFHVHVEPRIVCWHGRVIVTRFRHGNQSIGLSAG